MSRRQNLEETTSPPRPKEQVEVIKRIEEDIIFGRRAGIASRRGHADGTVSRHPAFRSSGSLSIGDRALREKNFAATVRSIPSDEVRQPKRNSGTAPSVRISTDSSQTFLKSHAGH
jgi:hypothetical protein